jgi:DNA repair exonuclease SbcCD ATPase subunit
MEIPDPNLLRRNFDRLSWERKARLKELEERKAALKLIEAFLEDQPRVAARLESLCSDLFGEILNEVERNLSYALQEIIGQDLIVVSSREVQRGKVHINFSIEHDGQPEDILTGQGGSVCNIISVGLRLIALSQLDEREHRRFLVLDEQDCWLRPDLVSHLMSIIYAIARRLNFQILVISHHDVHLFREYADRIYRIVPEQTKGEGVRLELLEDHETATCPNQERQITAVPLR